MHDVYAAVPGLIERVSVPGMFGGGFAALLGVVCLVFNRRLGGGFGRFSFAVFGTREKVEADEIIFRGLVCLFGSMCMGVGVMLLASAQR
jgi:hypothetical protein